MRADFRDVRRIANKSVNPRGWSRLTGQDDSDQPCVCASILGRWDYRGCLI